MIKHVKGNVFDSDSDVFLHQVNCQGVMGSGVAKQVRSLYPWVYGTYKQLCDNVADKKNLLGVIQPVYIDESRVVVNLFAQERFGYDGSCYTNYHSLRTCLEKVCVRFRGKKIAIPYRMGCHRGGGDWNVVSKMIQEVFQECDVTLYEYNGDEVKQQ